jgi:hypothetical protein
MTPTKKEIERKARELYADHCYRTNTPQLADITPELSELKENGFVSLAISELMTSTERKNEQWLNIDFPENFSVDVDLLFDSGGLILGSKHTGKSDLAFMIADKCMEKDAVVVVFDPSTDWMVRSQIKRFMKVEPYTILEVPKQSIIYDISLCSPQEQQKILENFSKKLFEYQAQAQDRKQYLVILEEAHTYFYQGCMRSKSLVNAVRLVSVGRNVKIATLLLSQFSSVLDKYLIKHNTSQIWLGYSREPNDIRYLRQIIGDNVSELPKLNDGEFLYMTRKGISKIAIQPYENSIPKTRIANPNPTLTPIALKPKQNNMQALASLIVSLLWFVVVLLMLSQGR